MPQHRSHRASQRLAGQALGLSLAVPQVVAHRVARMAAASSGPLSARDQREFTLMGAEKVAAFWESWAAMGQTMLAAQMAMAQSMWRQALLLPFVLAPGRLPGTGAMRAGAGWAAPAALSAQALQLASAGLAPVHRRATDNARRLSRIAKR